MYLYYVFIYTDITCACLFITETCKRVMFMDKLQFYSVYMLEYI